MTHRAESTLIREYLCEIETKFKKYFRVIIRDLGRVGEYTESRLSQETIPTRYPTLIFALVLLVPLQLGFG
jgi:hypothetical protein